ncbi:hypothetical protein SD70_12095 [Gordoniibacillus kamchatkensis]|uniref:Flagellar assembly factor FliW n=1 Tax=Gordoniibacillus kamchatkensis TaxID=1590651 RepID=A0ABR5AHY9_9BACL|nr:flagellar assembly protein FliW [Paenibacillus sp. VKM B-2647]KIL40651.1 hypothetical protein SD70_12095 [Paenibacillus sp. VKM B-2647]
MLDFLHERVVQFDGSILGFEHLNEFTLQIMEEQSPYAYLQSVADPNVGFLVASPFAFFQSYSLEIEEKDKEYLELASAEDAAILSIITIHEPFTASTMNLLAPLVINVRNNKGRQIVPPYKVAYTAKEPMFREALAKKGE